MRATYPYRKPEPPTPAHDGDEGLSAWLEGRRLDRRSVILRGALTGRDAGVVAAAPVPLGALDGGRGGRVSAGTDGAWAVGGGWGEEGGGGGGRAHAVGTAHVSAAGVAVLAAAAPRLASRHARIRLVEPKAAAVAGTADEVAAAAGQYLRELEELA